MGSLSVLNQRIISSIVLAPLLIVAIIYLEGDNFPFFWLYCFYQQLGSGLGLVCRADYG